MNAPVALAAPGVAHETSWAKVDGATAVEVSAGSLRVTPRSVDQDVGSLSYTRRDNHCFVTVPSGLRLHKLNLVNLRGPSSIELSSEAALAAAGLRLAVSSDEPSGQFGPPLCAVPSLPARGLMPPALTGALYQSYVLTIPALGGGRLRVSLVRGEAPEAFAAVEMQVDGIVGTATVGSKNVELRGQDDSVVWAVPGELPDGTPETEIDLRQPIRAQLEKALKSGAEIRARFALTGAAPSRALVEVVPAAGALVRTFGGVVRTVVAGEPSAIAFPGPALAGERPVSAVGDLTLRYDGFRVLADVSDSPPASDGGIEGLAVGEVAVLRRLPPGALSGLHLARVGLIGRAPVDCELALTVVDTSGGGAGAALGPPGIVRLAASRRLSTVWVDLPDVSVEQRPAALSLRANVGRFYWAGLDAPFIRLAVRDPAPAGRLLRLNGTAFAAVESVESHQRGFEFPAAAFGASAPVFESDLFLTIEISDLTLRYRR